MYICFLSLIYISNVCQLKNTQEGEFKIMLTRLEMKQRAKDSMSSASTHPVLVYLVYAVISIAVVGIIQFITGMFTAGLSLGSAALDNEAASLGALAATIPVTFIIGLVSFAITSVLAAGLTTYMLKTIRHQQAGVESIFSLFKQTVKIFCLCFMIQLFISLWSLLFIIPGIIATYRYAMAVYIYIDDPDKGVLQCITESKLMMVGHKWEYFVLQISFILWGLLCCVTCGLATLYVGPYIRLTLAVYYDNLKFVSNPQPTVESAPQM